MDTQSSRDEPDGETNAELEQEINDNRRVISENFAIFRDRYWDLYKRQGFTFVEAFMSWQLGALIPNPLTDDDEPWRNRG